MHIIGIIVIGFIVGLLAKLVMPGRDPGGLFITAAIGIIGSLIATYGGQALGIYHGEETAGFGEERIIVGVDAADAVEAPQ